MTREPGPSGAELRARLGRARVMLLFSPHLAPDPEALLAQLLPEVDVVQVRVKEAHGPTSARALVAWTRRVLDHVGSGDRAEAPLVLVNDRVDVAQALEPEGVSGVHLGQDDCPPRGARQLLGERALIGLSTHDARQVVAALEEPVDYLGFGPVHATATKGYTRGLGSEAAWIAHEASTLPLFPIGGIDLENASELDSIGRAAVSSALLQSREPAASARHLRRILTGG